MGRKFIITALFVIAILIFDAINKKENSNNTDGTDINITRDKSNIDDLKAIIKRNNIEKSRRHIEEK